MKNATTSSAKQIMGKLINDLQVVAPLHDSETVLEVVAHYLHQQRQRLLREERKHGRL